MPLMGRHSQNPQGNPAVLSSLQQLAQRAANGDAQARATLETVAAGGTTNGGQVPGWNGAIDWSSGQGRDAERAAAAALLRGDQQQFGRLAQSAMEGHRDWTGGTLANLAPAAIGFIPGIGLPAAVALGAATGAASNATGITRGNLAQGALRGGALAALGRTVSAPSTVTTPGGTFGQATTTTGPSLIARAPAAVGRFVSSNPEVALGAAGLAADVYGANRLGAAQDREAALNEEIARARLQPRMPFRTWQATRAPGGS